MFQCKSYHQRRRATESTPAAVQAVAQGAHQGHRYPQAPLGYLDLLVVEVVHFQEVAVAHFLARQQAAHPEAHHPHHPRLALVAL